MAGGYGTVQYSTARGVANPPTVSRAARGLPLVLIVTFCKSESPWYSYRTRTSCSYEYCSSGADVQMYRGKCTRTGYMAMMMTGVWDLFRLTFYATLLSPPYGVPTIRCRAHRLPRRASKVGTSGSLYTRHIECPTAIFQSAVCRSTITQTSLAHPSSEKISGSIVS